MTLPLEEGTDGQTASPRSLSGSITRYDLTGHDHRKWTETVRSSLVILICKLANGVKAFVTTPMIGTSNTLTDVVARSPGKLASHAEAFLDKGGIENRLLDAQVESEFLRQELLRREADQMQQLTRKTSAEALAIEIENQKRLIELEKQKRSEEIFKRLHEIADGRTEFLISNVEGDPAVIFANVRLEHTSEDERI